MDDSEEGVPETAVPAQPLSILVLESTDDAQLLGEDGRLNSGDLCPDIIFLFFETWRTVVRSHCEPVSCPATRDSSS